MLRSAQAQPHNEETFLLGKEQELARKIAEYQHRSWLQNEIPQLRAELSEVRERLEEVQLRRAIAESRASSHLQEQKLPPKRAVAQTANPYDIGYDLESLQRKQQSFMDEIENYDYLILQVETTPAQREVLTAFRIESVRELKQIERAIQNNPKAAAAVSPKRVKAPTEQKEAVALGFDDLDSESLLRKKQSLGAEIANYDYLIQTTPAERNAWMAYRAQSVELLRLVEEALQKNLEAAALVMSAVIVHPPLSLNDEKVEPLNRFDYIPSSRPVRAKAIRTFTEAETALIQQYIKEGQDLDDVVTRPLIECTIMSNTMLEFTFAPYSLIPEGWADYSLQYLEDHFKHARKAGNIYKDQDNKVHPSFVKTPNLDFPCTEDDIIPCNTLLLASGLLLEKAKRWQQKDASEPEVPELKTYSPVERRKYTSSTGLTAMDVVILEKIYQSLPSSRKLMFNCLLRDETDQIIESAVQLPDGYVYDESIPKKSLKLTAIHPPAGDFSAIHVYEGKCPRNPTIPFKLVNGVKNGKQYEIYSEIKPVLYFGRVVSLLKEHATKFVAQFKEQQARQSAKINPSLQENAEAAQASTQTLEFGCNPR